MRISVSAISRDCLRVGLLLGVSALIAWLTGKPFIFPSLGPSAFSLVVGGKAGNTGRRVMGGHLIGVAGGLLAYHLVARGLTFAALPSPHSVPLLRLAASGVISVALTTAGMLKLRAEHPPACATTLIVSLGIMSSFRDAFCIMLSVVLMYAVHKITARQV